MYELSWIDKDGYARAVYSSDLDELTAKMPTLRRPAKLKNGSGEIIGEVLHVDDLPRDMREQDKRRRWMWWYEND